MLKRLLRIVLPFILGVACVLPPTVAIVAVNEHNFEVSVQRHADVTLCNAQNESSAGMDTLIQFFRTQEDPHETAAQRATNEQFYSLLGGIFPKLNCSTNPITRKVSP